MSFCNKEYMLVYYLIDEANSEFQLKIKNVNKYWYKVQRFLINWNSKFNNLNFTKLQNKELIRYFAPIKYSMNKRYTKTNTLKASYIR